MVAVPELGKAVVFGGINPSAPPPEGTCFNGAGGCASSTWLFDGPTRTWTRQGLTSPPGPGAAWGFGMALGTKALFAGACNVNDGTNVLPSWLFDGTTWTPTTVDYPNAPDGGNGPQR